MKNKVLWIVIGLLVLTIGGTALIYASFKPGRNTLPPQYYQTKQSTSSASGPTFDHVVIIMEENKPEGTVIGSNQAPYINKLANQYARGQHYYAVTNPSLPNYIALTSGTTAGITTDCNPPSSSCQADVSNIADRLEQAGKTWKAYMESMPSPCYKNNSGDYAVKHNPFLYYPDITHNASRCQSHDVPFTQLSADLRSAGSLPDYVLITPNLCSDMHDCSVTAGDTWLSQQVPKILNSPAFTTQHSLLVITWDEGTNLDNNTPVVFAGPAAKTGYVSSTYFSHYSLLHTIENNWHLQPLTQNDTSAPLMTDMLR